MNHTARNNETVMNRVGPVSNYDEKRLSYTTKWWRYKIINEALSERMRRSHLLELLNENKIPFTNSTLKRDLSFLLKKGTIVRDRDTGGAYVYSRKEPLNLDEVMIDVFGIEPLSPIADIVTDTFEKAQPLTLKIIDRLKDFGLGPLLSEVKEVMDADFGPLRMSSKQKRTTLV